MSLEMIIELTSPFLNTKGMLSDEFAEKFVNEVHDIILERLNTMTTKEIKELDKDGLNNILE